MCILYSIVYTHEENRKELKLALEPQVVPKLIWVTRSSQHLLLKNLDLMKTYEIQDGSTQIS